MAVKEDDNTFEDGLAVEKAFLARARCGSELCYPSLDRSGGAQADRVTPAAVVQLLSYMLEWPIRADNELSNIKALDEAIRLESQMALAWTNKGNALNVFGRTTEADAAFAKAKEQGYSG